MYSFLNCLFISVLLFEIQLSKGGGLGFNYQEEVGWDSIIKRWWVVIQFTYQMFVHNQSQDPEFKRHMSWSF